MFKKIKRFIAIKLGKRCNGDCCKRFYLPYSPEELHNSYLRATGKLHDGGVSNTDVEIVYPMVELVEIKKKDSGYSHWYRCKNLDKNGDCRIYLTRPKMCSEYPQYSCEGHCNYKSCTWKEGRTPQELRKVVKGCKRVKLTNNPGTQNS